MAREGMCLLAISRIFPCSGYYKTESKSVRSRIARLGQRRLQSSLLHDGKYADGMPRFCFGKFDLLDVSCKRHAVERCYLIVVQPQVTAHHACQCIFDTPAKCIAKAKKSMRLLAICAVNSNKVETIHDKSRRTHPIVPANVAPAKDLILLSLRSRSLCESMCMSM
jgi:hypothetical protein